MTTKQILKIGLDIHGVIDAHPEIYSSLSHTMVEAGHEVHVITGVKHYKVKEKLEKWDIKYTHFFSIYQHLENLGYNLVDGDKDQPWFDHSIWNRVKADYCNKHQISFHIDDTAEYGDEFEGIFLHRRRPPTTAVSINPVKIEEPNTAAPLNSRCLNESAK